ncbi:hypothetical protein H0G86_007645 [Trichoderma simmonsii]|uniref:Uncharacterized protein n=1 Tax=Trichoderma simmonsii TaxID=1491479 RepID=A0A8G0LIE4_9HYPO|nr:hypothetical protein H0G86_007645 [Trichoderma simmonsii]
MARLTHHPISNLSKTTYHVGQLDHVQPPYLSSLLSAVFSSPTSPFPFPPFFPLSMVPSLGMTCSSQQKRKGTGGPNLAPQETHSKAIGSAPAPRVALGPLTMGFFSSEETMTSQKARLASKR